MAPNKWAKAPLKQWWQALIPAAASLVGGMMSNKQSEQNTALSYENTRMLRQTAYQDTTADLKAAGLNPMMAYQNSATSATALPVAQNKNVVEGAMNSAAAYAQVQNMKQQNELIQAQTEKTLAEAAAIPTSVAKTEAETTSIKATIPKIEQEIANLKVQNMTEQERVALTRAQNRLTQIQEDLAKSNITNVEAQTETQKVITTLKKLEIPGAKNLADWESRIGEAGRAAGAVGTGAKILEGLTNSARKVMGK